MVATSYGPYKNLDDEKKYSRTGPEIQSEELNLKLRSTLSEKQINSTTPAKTQSESSQKVEKLKQSNKLNRNIHIAFTPKPKFDPLKSAHFKIFFKTNFCFRNWYRVISVISGKNSIVP